MPCFCFSSSSWSFSWVLALPACVCTYVCVCVHVRMSLCAFGVRTRVCFGIAEEANTCDRGVRFSGSQRVATGAGPGLGTSNGGETAAGQAPISGPDRQPGCAGGKEQEIMMYMRRLSKRDPITKQKALQVQHCETSSTHWQYVVGDFW